MNSFLLKISSWLHLSKTKETIVQNLFWSVLGKIVALLSSLFVGIVVARHLGPEQYGLMDYVISYVFLFQTFAIFGLDSIEIREEARGLEPYQKIIGTAFTLKVFLGVICIAASVLTSWFMDADAYTTLLVAIYSLVIILNSFGVIRNYFTAIVQNEYVVKAEIARTLIGVGIKVLLLLLDASLTWFIVSYMFDFVLVSSGYYVAYHQKVGHLREWKFDYSYSKYLLRESFPLLLTSAAVIVYQRIDHVMIGQMIDKESVGYYSVAARFVEVLIYIPMMLAQTITPVLVSIREHDQEAYIRKAQQFMNLSFWCTLIVSLATSLLAYWIVVLTFGRAYVAAVSVLQVMAFKAAGVALSNTAGAMLVTEGLQRYAIFRDGLGCIVCVALNYLLLPRYGIMAAAVVAILSNVAAGYLADALIPAYRHIFVRQTKTLLLGWREVFNLKQSIQR
ncbi:MAG: flippase [Bacteroidaceae bacterium]|jgi:O-antigen/teichoic acid export membrane protein|nr:flippase [Bacteroidaceae bacterium]